MRSRRPWKRWTAIVLVLIVLVAATGAALTWWKFFKSDKQQLADDPVARFAYGSLDGELLADAEIVFAHLDNSRANQIFGPKNFVFTQQLLGVLDLAKAQARAKEAEAVGIAPAATNGQSAHEPQPPAPG